MRAVTRITFLDDNNEKFFGEGPARLLRGIEATGSLRAALIRRSTGGKDGGGSCLTDAGKELLARYEAYRDACIQANSRLYLEFFPEQR